MKKNIKIYNDRALEYAQKFDKSGIQKKEIDLFFKLSGKTNPAILDLGCANGRDAEYFLTKTSKYLGVDGAPKLIEIAQARNPQAQFITSDFQDLNFPKGNFDLIYDSASLFHLNKKELGEMLEKIFLWLKKDGLFLMTAKFGPYGKITNGEQNNKVQYKYSPELVLKLSKEAFRLEFQEIKSDYRNQTWFTVILRKK